MYDHPDMKDLAITLIRGIRGGTPPDESLAQSNVALAAATIAIVERLDRLISLKEAETGYGPIEYDGPDEPGGNLAHVEVRGPDDDIPY